MAGRKSAWIHAWLGCLIAVAPLVPLARTATAHELSTAGIHDLTTTGVAIRSADGNSGRSSSGAVLSNECVAPSEAACRAYRNHDPARAKTLAMKALEQDRSNPALLAVIGLSCMEIGDLKTAMVHLRELVRRNPDSGLALAYLGHCLALEGELASARSYLERALDRAVRIGRSSLGGTDTTLTRIHASLGYVYLKMEQWDLAKQHLNRALSHDPTLTSARYHLGLVMYCTGCLKDAAEAFASVSKSEPANLQVRYHLGLALIQQGRHRQGYVEIKKVLAAGSSPELTRLCQQVLDTDESAEIEARSGQPETEGR